MRSIKIEPALNGFIVQAGCQTVVFESVDALLNKLHDYLTDPAKTEKEFVASAINRKYTMPQEVCDSAGPAAGQAVLGSGIGRSPLSEAIREAVGNR